MPFANHTAHAHAGNVQRGTPTLYGSRLRPGTGVARPGRGDARQLFGASTRTIGALDREDPALSGAVPPMQRGTGKKSIPVAYLLWFLLGTFGAHRLYLRLYATGTVLLATALSSFLLMSGVFGQTPARVGYVTIWIPMVWALADLFLIPGLKRKHDTTPTHEA